MNRTVVKWFGPLLLCVVSGCITAPPRAPGIGTPIDWSELPGWRADRVSEAWPALLNSCHKISVRDERWSALCQDAALFPDPDDATARAFFETRFVPHVVVGANGAADGLMTGYYEPLLQGSRVRTDRFRYPLYRRPDDLVTVDLGGLYPELQGKRYRGRLDGTRVVPYYSRAELNPAPGRHPLAGQELLWVDDPVALFILEIQGSGRVQLPDGSVVRVGYADQNGHPYVAIGRTLVEAGELKLAEATLPTIRAWLKANPERAQAVLNSNPSYVFFALRETEADAPVGALNVPLSPQRSIAVDPAFIPLGSPVWFDTTLPGEGSAYRRLTFAQDTGGAIRGPLRADLFLGFGEQAERIAGAMRQRGRLYVLRPAPRGWN